MKGEPAVFGQHDDNTIAQLRDVASRAERAALRRMATRCSAPTPGWPCLRSTARICSNGRASSSAP
jgi:hypothetical protein